MQVLGDRQRYMTVRIRPINSEDGSAILLALIMLILLTLLGMAVTTTSVIEIKISNNDRNYKQRLMEADAGVSWAVARLNQANVSDTNNDDEFNCLKPYPLDFDFRVIKRSESTHNGIVDIVDIISQLKRDNKWIDIIWAGIKLPTPIRGALEDTGERKTY